MYRGVDALQGFPIRALGGGVEVCFHSSNPQWSRALIGAEGRPSSAMTQSSSFIPLFNLQFDGFFYLNASDVSDQGTRRVPLEPGVTCSSIPGFGTRDNQVVDESISDLSRVWGIIEGHLTDPTATAHHCHFLAGDRLTRANEPTLTAHSISPSSIISNLGPLFPRQLIPASPRPVLSQSSDETGFATSWNSGHRCCFFAFLLFPPVLRLVFSMA